MAEALQSLGRYRLQKKLGTGAMGVVPSFFCSR